MATKTSDPVQDTVARVTEFADEANKALASIASDTNKKIVEYLEEAAATQKKVTLSLIETYEESALRFVDSYEKAVTESKFDWLKDAVAPQTAAARELTATYVATAKQLVN
jgi:hypothetical protein